MDRPKRTVRKPAKYCDEETPVKRKKASSTKENLDPEEVTVESQLVSKTVTKISKKSTNVAKKPKTSKREIKNTGSKEEENVIQGIQGNEITEVTEKDRNNNEGIYVEGVGVNEVGSESDDDSSEDLSLAAPGAIASQITTRPVRNKSGKYQAEYSKTSRAGCRGSRCCGTKIEKGTLRIGKMVHIEYGNYGGGMGMGWWHMDCFFLSHNHHMKWEDFNGVEDLSVEVQKLLHERACRCAMPVELLANVMVTHAAIQEENKEKEEGENENRKAAATQKRQDNAARVEAVKSTSAEDLIREQVAKVIVSKTVDQLKGIVKSNGLSVERSAGGKGKKKGAPKKADYQDAIINADPLCKIGSLVQRAIRKHIKVDELRVLLENAGLPKTGSKVELTKRLLAHLGGDFGEESEEEKKLKKKRSDYDYDSDDYGYGFGFSGFGRGKATGFSVYEKDEPHPDIVNSARSGDLEAVKEILRKTVRPVATVNASRKWTEVEEKWGYDKSWDWHDGTPLLVASENGHVEVVYYLLTMEADPTLKGCTACDVTESPLSAVEKKIASISGNITRVKTNTQGTNSTFGFSGTMLLTKLKRYQVIKDMLCTANSFWDTASYASASYSDARKTAFSRQPNKPKDLGRLMTELGLVSRDINIDASELRELEASITELREKERLQRVAELQKQQEIREKQRVQQAEREKKLQAERIEREKRQKAEKERQRVLQQEQEKKLKVQREERERLQKEEKERVNREFQEKVKAALADQLSSSSTHIAVSHVPLREITQSNAIQQTDLADNGVYYEGIMVDWRGTYGFLKLSSPPLAARIFVHKSDMTNSHRICRDGMSLKFQLTKSKRKPGTVQAKNATIL